MAVQIVVDHTGDSRYPFNPNDTQAVAKAEKRFEELTGIGFTAAVRIASGEVSRVRSFDPTAEETLFFPRLVGGCARPPASTRLALPTPTSPV